MARRIVKTKPEPGSPLDLERRMTFVRWIMGKIKVDEGKKEQAEVRAAVVSSFEDVEPDESGHRTVVLDEPIMGFGEVTYQRRVSYGTNLERALEILTEHGLLEDCTRLDRQIDEEAVMTAVSDGRLDGELLSEMYPMKETFAVVVKHV